MSAICTELRFVRLTCRGVLLAPTPPNTSEPNLRRLGCTASVELTGAGVAVGGSAQPAAGGRHAVGAAELHGVLLLPRLVQGPRALPRVLKTTALLQ